MTDSQIQSATDILVRLEIPCVIYNEDGSVYYKSDDEHEWKSDETSHERKMEIETQSQIGDSEKYVVELSSVEEGK